MDMLVADPLHGALLGGRYRVMGRLARGGMATVYQARDERLERAVALKIIHPDHARDPQFLDRLSDEAKTVARLAHPNIVAVYDQGTHDGAPYLVMEYVRGRTLREVLNDRRRLDPNESLAILEQILAALALAHREGLVHRDVKPENILVAAPPNGSGDLVDAVVKVADFGLAHAAEITSRPARAATGGRAGGAEPIDERTSGRSEGGSDREPVFGTAEYVAPELVSDGRADARADVYSAGVVLFEMLTGRPPYDGDRAVDVAWQHVDQDVPPPSQVVPGLPPLLDDMVIRSTRRDPARRPRDAGAMLALVQTARDDVGALAGPTRAIAHPTVVVPAVPAAAGRGGDPRPSWARLPASRAPLPAPRAGGPTAAGDATDLLATTPAGPRLAGLTDPLRRLGSSANRQLDRMRSTAAGRRKLIAILVVIGLIVLTGGWWLGFGRYTSAPALVDLTKDNAVIEASRLGFTVNYGAGLYSETVPVDTVLRQTPGAGGRILRGGTVTVYLSLGQERHPIPDVAGQSADFALTQLKFFVVQKADGYSDTLPVGYVTGTDPPAGTPAKPNAPVKLFVVKGPFPAHVPTVVGLQRADAENQLKAAGFQVDTQVKDDQTQPKDKVLDQNPPGGQGLATAQGVKVTIVVASGPPGTPMPSVVGARCPDAINALQAAGFQVDAQGSDVDKQLGTVRGQSPNPNDPVQPGQQVHIQCSVF
jgi:beta-lactam-binding protein with PASTA domain/tRNA A-37 threonylcarbamoyl transferase component Bud32